MKLHTIIMPTNCEFRTGPPDHQFCPHKQILTEAGEMYYFEDEKIRNTVHYSGMFVCRSCYYSECAEYFPDGKNAIRYHLNVAGEWQSQTPITWNEQVAWMQGFYFGEWKTNEYAISQHSSRELPIFISAAEFSRIVSQWRLYEAAKIQTLRFNIEMETYQ